MQINSILRLSYTVIGIFVLNILHAQIATTPYWVTKLPKAETENYYYRVTTAEGKDYNEAYTKAFSFAILESQWKLGVKVKKAEDVNQIEKGLTESINVQSQNMNLPLNKVCEYIEPIHTSKGVRLYVLWQVARYGNVDPKFKDFTECE